MDGIERVLALSFDALIDYYGDMVWRIALAHEHNAAVAEELYQEICFALWSSCDRIEAAEQPKAYVARIAMNQAISHVRREVKLPETVVADVEAQSQPQDDAPLDETLHRLHQQERLLAAVQQLPLNWRQPVTLTLEGFKPAEIAYVMGTSANSVSLRLTRAKTTLRKLLNDTPTSPRETVGATA